MSTLTLIRHGQARTFQKESDRLSMLGEQQARRLGEFWSRCGLTFDSVFTGPLVRQQQTADLVISSMNESGVRLPSPVVVSEFEEYDSKGILNRLVPELAGRDAAFRTLVDAFEKAETERNRHFQRMFEIVVQQWLEGSLEAPEVESWADFRSRVHRGLDKIISEAGGGKRIAVFTSGGPIAVALQRALKAPDRSAIEVNWRVRNCSLTEFVFGAGRFSLDTFNAIPHLDDPMLVSYR